MKKFILLAIVSLCLSNVIDAQTVSATFFNVPQQKVYLNAYTGLYMEVLDSVMLSHDGRAEFNTPLQKGMFQLETESGLSIDFLYDNKNVAFLMKNPDDILSVEFIDSKINTDWYRYLYQKNKCMDAQSLLKPIIREYDKNSQFYITTKNEYLRLQNDFNAFVDELINNQDNYATTLIKVDRPLPINLDDDFNKQRKDMIDNFFNDVDFNDLSLIPTNVLTTKIIDFISIQQTNNQTFEQQEMSIILAVDYVLNLATVNFDMYKFIFQYLMEGFNELGFNAIVDFMTRLPYAEQIKCSDEQYNELLEVSEFYSRVKIGKLAQNISGVTLFNEDFDLYSIDNEYVIVLFWSYSCPHCREIIEDLKVFLDENKNFSMIAVSVKGELNKIKKFAKKQDMRAYFYHDGLEWNSPHVNNYAITSTPTMFLLDKDKKIIYKPFDFQELIEFLNIIK